MAYWSARPHTFCLPFVVLVRSTISRPCTAILRWSTTPSTSGSFWAAGGGLYRVLMPLIRPRLRGVSLASIVLVPALYARSPIRVRLGPRSWSELSFIIAASIMEVAPALGFAASRSCIDGRRLPSIWVLLTITAFFADPIPTARSETRTHLIPASVRPTRIMAGATAIRVGPLTPNGQHILAVRGRILTTPTKHSRSRARRYRASIITTCTPVVTAAYTAQKGPFPTTSAPATVSISIPNGRWYVVATTSVCTTATGGCARLFACHSCARAVFRPSTSRWISAA